MMVWDGAAGLGKQDKDLYDPGIRDRGRALRQNREYLPEKPDFPLGKLLGIGKMILDFRCFAGD